MLIEVNRNYKDASAEETIFNIRKLLHDIDILTIELNWSNPYNEIYSLSISLDEEHGLGQTHGKGRNPAYTLASGYGEFMERAQNMPIEQFSSKIFSDLFSQENGFYYHPDEKKITEEEFIRNIEKIKKDAFTNEEEIYKFNDLASIYQITMETKESNQSAVPFYDVKNGDLIYIPYRFIFNHCLSNGMCAGNSPEEALCQGLYEIIERDASKKLYFNKICPPTISKNYLKKYPKELEIIEEIEKEGLFEVIVKDFSIGLNYPVIGVIIIDKIQNSYKVSVGCDSVFQIALSRAITEFYQGIDRVFVGTPLPDAEYPFFISDDLNSMAARAQNYFRQFRPGPSVYPKRIFDDNPNYEFNEDTYRTAKNYKEELKRLINIFLNQGRNVYIRNTSFLGFPSFQIFIPSVSWMFNDVESMFLYFNREEMPDLTTLSKSSDPALIHTLLKKLNEANWSSNVLQDVYHLKFKMRSQLKYLFDKPYLMSVLYYVLGDVNKSNELLTEYLSNSEKQTYFNKATKLFFEFKINGDNNIIDKIISSGIPENVAKEIENLFIDPNKTINNYKFPKCPDCSICELKNDCLTKNSIKAINKIYLAMRKKEIDQMRIADYLN